MPQTGGQSCNANGGERNNLPAGDDSWKPNEGAGTLRDNGRQRDFKRIELGGQNWKREPENWHDYEPGTRQRHCLSWFRSRRTGVTLTAEQPIGATGEGGVFSPDSKVQFGGKSIFNKEKYLPLVYTPFLISHYCCHVMKKRPMKAYQHKNHVVPFLGTLAAESRIRKQAWIRNGCNAFDSKEPKSQPLSFWTEQDILRYIVEYGIDIAPVYGEIVATDEDGNEYAPNFAMCEDCTLKCTGADRTGCIFCGFGFHCEKGETRFQRIARTHPRQYEYCMDGGQWADNPFYDPTAPEYDGDWKNWNPPKIWVPSKKGLGMRKVFEMTNEIYGKDFYRYE